MTQAMPPCLTVQQLIDALQALPEEAKRKPVHCYAEAGCVITEIYGIAKEEESRVILDGW